MKTVKNSKKVIRRMHLVVAVVALALLAGSSFSSSAATNKQIEQRRVALQAERDEVKLYVKCHVLATSIGGEHTDAKYHSDGIMNYTEGYRSLIDYHYGWWTGYLVGAAPTMEILELTYKRDCRVAI